MSAGLARNLVVLYVWSPCGAGLNTFYIIDGVDVEYKQLSHSLPSFFTSEVSVLLALFRPLRDGRIVIKAKFEYESCHRSAQRKNSNKESV